MTPKFSQPSEEFRRLNPQLFAIEPPCHFAPDPAPMSKDEAKSEKQLQEQIAGFLERNGIVVIRSRTDRRTTTNLGTPDLLFSLKGRAIAFEVKLPHKHPTHVQVEMMRKMTRNGWDCYVVEGYDQAVETVNKLFLQFTLEESHS